MFGLAVQEKDDYVIVVIIETMRSRNAVHDHNYYCLVFIIYIGSHGSPC